MDLGIRPVCGVKTVHRAEAQGAEVPARTVAPVPVAAQVPAVDLAVRALGAPVVEVLDRPAQEAAVARVGVLLAADEVVVVEEDEGEVVVVDEEAVASNIANDRCA